MNNQTAVRGLADRARRASSEGLSFDSINDRFREAVIARGSDRPLLADWIDVLRQALSPNEIQDRLLAVQGSVDRPLKSILFELQSAIGHAGLRSRLGTHIDRLKEHWSAQAVLKAWSAHLEGKAFETEDYFRCRDGEIEVTLGTLLDEIKLIYPERDRDQEKIVEAGLSVADVQALRQKFSCLGEDLRGRIENEFSPKIAQEICSRERYGYFKYEVLRTGRLTIYDPVSGAELHALDSFRAFGRTIYMFRGEHLYYLVCGGLGDDAIGLVIPSKSIALVLLKGNASLLTGMNFASLAAALLTRIARDQASFQETYKRGQEDIGPRMIKFLVEKTENFAHHLWNFYSSVDHAIDLGVVDRIDAVLFSGTEFFGPLGRIFPPLAEKVQRPRKNNISDPCPYSKTHLLLGAGSFFMSRSLPRRIERALHVDLPLAGSPVVWLGMRLRDKSWVDQEAELPKLIKLIAERYPDATFLIDGFSLPVSEAAVMPQWQSFADTMALIADNIVSACPGCDVRSLVGTTLADAVSWAARTDVYLAPLGSTQHKVGWFTDAPGLVYASPSFGGRTHTTPGAWAAAISTPPIFIIGAGATPGERRGFNRNREKMENVRLNTRQLADIMLLQLEERLSGVKPNALTDLGNEIVSLDPEA